MAAVDVASPVEPSGVCIVVTESIEVAVAAIVEAELSAVVDAP